MKNLDLGTFCFAFIKYYGNDKIWLYRCSSIVMFSLNSKVKLSETLQPDCNAMVNRSVMLHAKLYRPVILYNYPPKGR